MIYLILAICSSAMISIVMRWGEDKINNNISTLAVNYVTCLMLGLLYTAGAAGTAGIAGMAAGEGAASKALFMGLLNGVFYVGGFVLLQYNIGRNGVVLSSTFMKLGVLVPTMTAVVVFGEHPGILHIAGIIIAISAILLLNKPEKDQDNTEADRDARAAASEAATVTAPKALILLLLVGGSGDAMSKIFEELGDSAYNSQFLLYTFLSALILCTLTALVTGQRLTPADILYGCMIGIPNYYSARFLLMSLSYVPAVTAYPTYSTGTIMLVGAAGVLLFREKMTARQWMTVAMIIVALILLNI